VRRRREEGSGGRIGGIGGNCVARTLPLDVMFKLLESGDLAGEDFRLGQDWNFQTRNRFISLMILI
jgi:hypothetical protein